MNDDYDDDTGDLIAKIADRDAEIKRLEAEIERLKCCGNCKHLDSGYVCPLHNFWSCEPHEYCDKWQSDNLIAEGRK